MGKYLDILKPDRRDQNASRQETLPAPESTPVGEKGGEAGSPSHGGSTPMTYTTKTTKEGSYSRTGGRGVGHQRPAPGATTKTTETTKVTALPAAAEQASPRAHPARELVERFLGMTLDEFERVGSCLEVAVPGLEQTLWFVPGLEQVDSLRAGGVRRGRIWTAAELRDLMAAPGMSHEDAVAIARAKLTYNATVTAGSPTDTTSGDLDARNREKDR